MKYDTEINKKTPKMLKIGNFCVIILTKKNVEKLQEIRQVFIGESSLNNKSVDKSIKVSEGKKMEKIAEKEKNIFTTTENENLKVTFDNVDTSVTETFPTDHPLSRLDGQTADYLVTYFNLGETVPVDLSEMLKQYNIALRVTDFKSFEEFPDIAENIPQKGKVLGAVKTINDRVNIFYRKGDTPHRQRFTIAHEFAHCCLNAKEIAVNGHIDFRLDIEEATEDEYAANVFAGELLIPKNVLDSIYNKVPEPNINTLAYAFDVSVNVMEERLKYLGYKYKKSILSSFQNQIEKFKYGLMEF